jgi:hypothetical protein
MTRDLSDHRGDVLMKFEIATTNEEASDAPEVQAAKEVFEVNVEDIPPRPMLSRIGNDGQLTPKAMRDRFTRI